MASAKEQMTKIVQDQPEDSSYDEILRELALARMIETFTSSKTRHIMQAYGAKDDTDSINMTASGLEDAYDEFKETSFDEEWERLEALEALFNIHNPGDAMYGGRVAEIYEIIHPST
jgi:DnaJ-domain-containing protein 1